MRTNGAECENNNVDAEAMLKFLMNTLRDQVEHLDARAILEQKIRVMAEAARDDTGDVDQAVAYAEAKADELKQQIDIAAKNLMLETDDKLKDHMRTQFAKLQQELTES